MSEDEGKTLFASLPNLGTRASFEQISDMNEWWGSDAQTQICEKILA